MMSVGNNPAIDRVKLGTKKYILTDKYYVPLSTAVITSVTKHANIALTKCIAREYPEVIFGHIVWLLVT